MLDLLLPQRCVLCRAPGAQLCAGCRDGLPGLTPPLCDRCGAPTAWPVARCRECSGRPLGFATARAAVAYDDAVRAVVAAWKERGLRRLAGAAAELVAARVPRPPATLVAFVPPDDARRRERGHHPAARLAEVLAERWNAELADVLVRTRPAAARQRGLSRSARAGNVAGAFRARTALGGAVCVVDDVYTSGATAAAAAEALLSAGATRVDVVTFARAIRMPAVGLHRALKRPT